MEVIHTILVIYAALCLECAVILTGAQKISISKYNNPFFRGEDVTLICYFPVKIPFSNCQWYFTQNGGVERPLTNGTRYTWSCIQSSADPVWVPIQISFKNAAFTDTGKYTCEVVTASGAVSNDLLLTVLAKPEITVPKINYTAVSGTNLTLDCLVNANGETITSIEWEYKVNQQWIPARKSGKYFWTIQMPSLVISEVQTSDSTFYRCLASTRLGTAEGSAIFLNVQNLPLVTVQQTQFYITSGEDVVLNCTVNGRGEPKINVKWYRLSQALLSPLPNNMKYGWRQFGPDASIGISKVTENDTGIYVCEGTTEVGSSKGNDIELRVGYKPTVTVNEYNYSVGIGANLTLHCSIDGHGGTVKRVEWLKETSSHSTYLQPTTRVFWNISSPSIKITFVQFVDAGKYTCIGMTEFGRTKSLQIHVQIFSKPIILIPVYEYQPKNGTTVSLQARIEVTMQTLLSVQWEKYKEDNQQWYPLEKNSRLFWTYTEPSLTIATALVEDDGKYRIIGRTAYHEVTSYPIKLTIYIPVKIKELETRPVVIREGDKVEIRCLVYGKPEPRVIWRLANGTTIVTSSLENVQGNILILENVTNLNEGNYTCIAQNNFSSDESLISLIVSDLPVINQPDKEDQTGSSLEKYVVPGVSVVAFLALIALIVVVILVRRKRLKKHKDKTNSGIRSTNGQQQPSLSENICSGNDHAKFYVNLSEDMTYAQVIRKSNKNIDGNKSSGDTKISQSNTHIDGSNCTRETDTSQVYMNINNTYAAVQHRSSTSNSNSNIHEETESENTQVKRNEQLNYAELEFGSNTQDENSSLVIRGSPSNTTYTDVVVFTR